MHHALKTFVNYHRAPGEVWRYYPYSRVPRRYAVSSHGRVVSVRGRKPRFLKLYPNKYGYLRCSIRRNYTKILDTLVHVAVLETFRRKKRPGEQARHWDDDQLNNHIDNLLWGTAQDNADDRVRNDGVPRGQRHYKTQLTDAQVALVLQDTRTVVQIAADYGVHPSVIGYAKLTARKQGKAVHTNKRGGRGTANTKAKLTEENVRAIRGETGILSAIAQRYGVSIATVGKIRNNQLWTHVL